MSRDEYIQRFDKLEGMMAQLINTVGNMMEEQTSIKNDISSIKKEQTSMREGQTSMKNYISSIKEENGIRHKEVMDQLALVKADQDVLWDKSIQNEREIGIVKKLYNL
ncbi:hypothetical protein ACFOUV_09030 [Oceanobacillus longus]|uniref:Uncharacterized protein n=1 Tax=Oceanobacillus longus TaxID=930120 RepID=A0ABV8GYD1_9BACI